MLSSLVPVYPAAQEASEDESEGEVFVLPSFVVTTSSDELYRSTNSTSAFAIDMEIRNLPVPISVLNREFLEDQQAFDLDEALAYEAGAFTQSFTDNTGANDEFGSRERSPSGTGVNNFRTNSVSIRGYSVPNQQRLGFRIGATAVGEGFSVTLGGLTDTVSTERVEVVRGPASLLYGINVLSGVINTMPKLPVPTDRQVLSTNVTIGSDGLMRADFDLLGPLVRDRIHYRLYGATQKSDHWTDFREEESHYTALQVEWMLRKNDSLNKLLLEVQYGDYRRQGIGGSFFRDSFSGGAGGNTNELEVNRMDFRNQYNEHIQFGFNMPDAFMTQSSDPNDPEDIFLLRKGNPTAPYENPMLGDSYRISGPDTFYDREEFNALALLYLNPIENLSVEAGAYYTQSESLERNVRMRVFTFNDGGNVVTPKNELSFFETSPIFGPDRINNITTWNRNPEVLALIGSPDNLGEIDAITDFTFDASQYPRITTPFAAAAATPSGLGEVFVVPNRAIMNDTRDPQSRTLAQTVNPKFANYNWVEIPGDAETIQARLRGSYRLESSLPIFEDARVVHTFIGGINYVRDKLSVVTGGSPGVNRIYTPGSLAPNDSPPPKFEIGNLANDPYVLRSSVFDYSPIRYNGESTAIVGNISRASALLGANLLTDQSLIPSDPEFVEGSIPGAQLVGSGWRDLTVDTRSGYFIYHADAWSGKINFYGGLRTDSYQIKEEEKLRVLDYIYPINALKQNPDNPGPFTDVFQGAPGNLTLTPYLISSSKAYTQDQWISALPDTLNQELRRELAILRDELGTGGTSNYLFDSAQNYTTATAGVSLRLTEDISLYTVYSEGIFPNQGQRDGLDRPIDALETSSVELGFKFELWDNLVSGTLSTYKLTRENATWDLREAPSPRRFFGGRLGPLDEQVLVSGRFYDAQGASTGSGPRADLVAPELFQSNSIGIKREYVEAALAAVSDKPLPDASNLTPGNLQAMGMGFAELKEEFDHEARFENASYRFQYIIIDHNEDFEEGVNLGQLATLANGQVIDFRGIDWGAVMRDAFDRGMADRSIDGIPFLYRGFGNIALEGILNNASSITGDLVTFEEETTGVDGQILISPLKNYQIRFSFSYQKREVVGNGFNLAPLIDPKTGEKVKGSPYDRWVYVLGAENFTDPTDPTTFTGEGVNGMNLSNVPEWSWSAWNIYKFQEGLLDGVEVGAGVRYQGPAPTSIPIGGADLSSNRYPTPDTKERYTFDARIAYRWDWKDVTLSLSLNVYNLLDDRIAERVISYDNPDDPTDPILRRSRIVYAPRAFRLSLSAKF